MSYKHAAGNDVQNIPGDILKLGRVLNVACSDAMNMCWPHIATRIHKRSKLSGWGSVTSKPEHCDLDDPIMAAGEESRRFNVDDGEFEVCHGCVHTPRVLTMYPDILLTMFPVAHPLGREQRLERAPETVKPEVAGNRIALDEVCIEILVNVCLARSSGVI